MQIDKKNSMCIIIKFGSIRQVERYLLNFSNPNYSASLSQALTFYTKIYQFLLYLKSNLHVIMLINK